MRIYLRILQESVLMAWHALVVNKLRTLLSLLGVTIGIFAIVSVFTAVDGLENSVRSGVDQLGSNVVYIEKWPWAFGGDYPWWKYWQRPLATVKEMEELKDRVQLAEAVCFFATVNNQTFKYRSNSVENADISIVTHEYDKVWNFNLQDGRYFTEAESAGGYPVALIGHDIAEGLFPFENPIDKLITVRGRKVTIIGVYTREGESFFGNSNDQCITIQASYARKFIDLKSDRLNPLISVKAKAGISNRELMDELRGAMRSIRRQRPIEEDNFALNETKLLATQVNSLFGAISMGGWIIGGFSILVGGFGIANIMFVSVRERTPIIGIQKSLGARSYFILIQYLTESVVLCVIGGLLGLFLVFLGTFAAAAFDFEMHLSMNNIVLGLGVSALIGVISGFVPAYTASQLDPVEAIRANG